MAKLNIKGVGEIEAPEGFADLSSAEKQKVVNRLARQALEDRQKSVMEPESSGIPAALRTAGQGLALGFGDEIEAGLRTGFGFLGDYDETVGDIRQDIDLFAKDNPLTAAGLTIGGGLLTGGVGAARAGAALAAREGANALGRRLAGTAAGRTLAKTGPTGIAAGVGAGEGAIAGAGAADEGSRLGGAGVGLLAGGAFGAAAPALTSGAVSAAKGIGTRLGIRGDDAVQEAADLKVLQAFERAKTTPEKVGEELRAAQEAGVTGMMVADVGGDATRRMAAGSANVTGEGMDIAKDVLDQRARSMGDEIASEVGTVLAGGKTAAQATEEIIERQSANAGQDYNRAFFVDGNPAGDEVMVPVDDLKGLLGGARMKSAYQQAVETAELEGVQMPKYDDLISGKATEDISLRQLHYMKIGLDGAIETGGRQGSLASNQKRLLVGRKNEFLKLLDEASPQIDGESSYKIARTKFAGDAALRDAIEEGKKFMTGDVDELTGIVAKMSDSEKEAFRIGVAQAVRNSVDSVADLGDAGKRIFGTDKKKKLLRVAFPDQKSFDQFEKNMMRRAEQVQTRNKVVVGSRTAPLGEDIDDLSVSATLLDTAVRQGVIPAALQAGGRVTSRGLMGERVGSQVARNLFETDAARQQAFLNRLIEARGREATRQAAANRRAFRRGAASGIYGGLLAGEE